MSKKHVTVAWTSGLHARPASVFTQAVAATGADVTLARPGEAPVDATSILSVMGLSVGLGEEIVLGSDDESALEQLAQLLESDLHEEV